MASHYQNTRSKKKKHSVPILCVHLHIFGAFSINHISRASSSIIEWERRGGERRKALEEIKSTFLQEVE